jgi:hypothetical protein
VQFASPVKGETIVCPAAHEISMGCVSMFAQESMPPAIDEQATARQLGLSEVEMARTLRAAVCSGVVLVTETANIALVITLAAALTCG